MAEDNTVTASGAETVGSARVVSEEEQRAALPKSRVFLAHEDRMTLHCPIGWEEEEKEGRPSIEGGEFERPERLRRVMSRLDSLEQRLMGGSPTNQPRFLRLSCPPATRKQILLAHSQEHYDEMVMSSLKTLDELKVLSQSNVEDDVYFCSETFLAASLACGGCCRCVDAVTDPSSENGGSTRAIAVVRPPGHHACEHRAMGFCFLNSVAVASKYAIATGRAKRVLIVDWDVHHGNGTEELTYDNPNIFYVSLHRYDLSKRFFPETGPPSRVSDGTNLNVAWKAPQMGNAEYAAAFSELILPLVAEWKPDLILVSCGLDAAGGDPIGDCRLTPPFYSAMTRSLLQVAGANVPMVVALEGGYNLDVVGECMEAVAFALLDEDMKSSVREEEFVGSPLVCLPVQEDKENSVYRDTTVSDRLALAREELAGYWRYAETESGKCAEIDVEAIKNINKSIGYIQKAALWKDRPSLLRPLLAPNDARRPPTSDRKLRRRGMPQAEDLEGLGINLQKLSMRTP